MIRLFIVNKLWKIKARLNVVSLRMAIEQADKINASTGRKMIVIFNSDKMEYEAVEKQLLKTAANARKVKGQPAKTEYRKKQKEKKPGAITHQRVHRIEKRSLYVTRKTG
jgi:hypothetical protein